MAHQIKTLVTFTMHDLMFEEKEEITLEMSELNVNLIQAAVGRRIRHENFLADMEDRFVRAGSLKVEISIVID